MIRYARQRSQVFSGSKRRYRSIAWIGSLVLAAGTLTCPPAAAVVPAGPGGPRTPDASGTGSLPLSYLQAQAAYHYMGYSLSPTGDTPAPANVVAPAFSLSQCGKRTSPLCGFDVSAHQSTVNFAAEKNAGARFVYIKATEATYYQNPYFAAQFKSAHDAGLYHGAYTFAVPSYSSAAAQAKYLVQHGGKWASTGGVLPAVLDIEFNPYGSECYGMTQGGMRSWVNSFLTTYHSLTKRWPVLYTNENWWLTCIGTAEKWSVPAKDGSALWIACYCASAGSLPLGYKTFSFWQLAPSGRFAGDQDVWNGTFATLNTFAVG